MKKEKLRRKKKMKTLKMRGVGADEIKVEKI